MYGLRHCLCSYVLNFDNDEEATDEKNAKHFFGVKITKFGWRKRRRFVPRLKPAQKEQLAFQSFSVTSPITTGSWARNPVLCEEVVSPLCDKSSLTVSMSGSLKSQYFFVVENTSSSVLLLFLVERSKWFKILFHSMK